MLKFSFSWLILALLPCASWAENKQIETFGNWALYQEVDPIFGILGYEIVNKSHLSPGTSTLSYSCSFESGNSRSYTQSVSVYSDEFKFPKSESEEVISLLKFEGEDTYEASWLVTSRPNSVALVQGSVNQDDDNDLYEKAIRDASVSDDPLSDPQRDILAGLAIQRLAWNLTRHDSLALGFEKDGKRFSMKFNLDGSDRALRKLFTICSGRDLSTKRQEVVSFEQAQIDAREAASWQQQRLGSGQSVQYEVGEYCVEIAWGEKPRGVPIVVDIDRKGANVERKEFLGKSLVLQGPIKSLKVRIGEDFFKGVVGLRSWEDFDLPCVGL